MSNKTITDSMFTDPGALDDCLNRCRNLIREKKALRDAVREVRDEATRIVDDTGDPDHALWYVNALTRILDEEVEDERTTKT